jgi:flagellin-like hook-associated protein FlgL
VGITLTNNKGIIRALNSASNELVRASERLSTGMRINRAADDAAGLSIFSDLQVQSRLYSQSLRNINDALSALSIATAATSELYSIVTRIAELAEQGANGLHSHNQRTAIDDEAQALRSEFNRIVQTTSFNGVTLLNQSNGFTIQVGTDGQVSSTVSTGGMYALTQTVGDGTFDPGTTTVSGAQVWETVTGDYNSDGNLDVVTLSSSGAGFRLSLGNGDGTFGTPTSIISQAGSGLNTADLNSDGKMDLVASQNGVLRVLLGNGDGTFSNYVLETFAANPSSVLIGDVDQDGVLDIVRTGSGTGEIQVYSGNGDGSFAARVNTAVSTQYTNYSLNDVNDDGKLELIAATTGAPSLTFMDFNTDGTASVRLVNNDFLTSSLMYAFGDMNADGYLDISYMSNASGYVALGNGDGTFGASLSIAGANPGSIQIQSADVNDDGYSDTAIFNGGTVKIYLANGDGTMASPTTYSTGATIVGGQASAVDVNNDGALDFVIANRSDSSFSVNLGNAVTSYELKPLSLMNRTNAEAAIDTMKSVRDAMGNSLGRMGAVMSRLGSIASVNTALKEAHIAAASRIGDADIASEVATMIKNSIRQQLIGELSKTQQIEAQMVLKLLR